MFKIAFKSILVLIFMQSSFAKNFSFDFVNNRFDQLEIDSFNKFIQDLAHDLPSSFIDKVPANMKVVVRDIESWDKISNVNCIDLSKLDFAKYEKSTHTLILDDELFKQSFVEKEKSVRLNCLAQTSYEFAKMQIIQELFVAHEYSIAKKNWVQFKQCESRFMKLSDEAQRFYTHDGSPKCQTLFFELRKAGMSSLNENMLRLGHINPEIGLINSASSHFIRFIAKKDFQCRKPQAYEALKTYFGFDAFPRHKCAKELAVLHHKFPYEKRTIKFSDKSSFSLMLATSNSDLFKDQVLYVYSPCDTKEYSCNREKIVFAFDQDVEDLVLARPNYINGLHVLDYLKTIDELVGSKGFKISEKKLILPTNKVKDLLNYMLTQVWRPSKEAKDTTLRDLVPLKYINSKISEPKEIRISEIFKFLSQYLPMELSVKEYLPVESNISFDFDTLRGLAQNTFRKDNLKRSDLIFKSIDQKKSYFYQWIKSRDVKTKKTAYSELKQRYGNKVVAQAFFDIYEAEMRESFHYRAELLTSFLKNHKEHKSFLDFAVPVMSTYVGDGLVYAEELEQAEKYLGHRLERQEKIEKLLPELADINSGNLVQLNKLAYDIEEMDSFVSGPIQKELARTQYLYRKSLVNYLEFILPRYYRTGLSKMRRAIWDDKYLMKFRSELGLAFISIEDFSNEWLKRSIQREIEYRKQPASDGVELFKVIQ